MQLSMAMVSKCNCKSKFQCKCHCNFESENRKCHSKSQHTYLMRTSKPYSWLTATATSEYSGTKCNAVQVSWRHCPDSVFRNLKVIF